MDLRGSKNLLIMIFSFAALDFRFRFQQLIKHNFFIRGIPL